MPSSSKPLSERQRFWREHLRRCQAAGQSIAAYAAANQLSRFSLYAVSRQMRLAKATGSDTLTVRSATSSSSPSSTTPRFVRVSASILSPLPCRAHLRNGVIVEVGVNAGELGAVLHDLAQLP